MQRRAFLTAILAPAALAPVRRRRPLDAGSVMTVTGPVAPEEMGLTLPHEHVLVDFIGAERASPDRYDREVVLRTVLPHLQRFRDLGGRTLCECTPAYLGRDPVLLRNLARASGLHILTNTGYYGARKGRHLPPHATTESADELAARWVREWEEGLDGTGIRPGFVKIGVERAPFSEVDRKLVRAAARTHRRTGLTVAVHTGDAAGALEQLALLEEEGVHPSAWIWVHAQAEEDTAHHVHVAERGGWVEFDGLGPDTVDRHVDLLANLRAHGLLGRALVSHDAGWYHVGEPGGGTFRPYTTLFARLLPALRGAGFTDDELHRLTVTNPAEAFTVRVRAR